MDLASLKSHPGAALFPILEGVDFDALVLDIKLHGVRVPVVIWDGGGEWLLLDGRNRVRAADAAGLSPSKIPHMIYEGDPIAYIFGANLYRRHLSKSQRSLIAAELDRLIGLTRASSDPKAKGSTSKDGQGKTADQAAKAMGVSRAQVHKAKNVVAKAAPAVMDAVRTGKITVHEAEAIVGLTPEEQTQLVQEVLGGAARNIREAAVAAGYIEESPLEIQVKKVVAALRGLQLEQLRMLRDEVDAMIRAQEAA